MDQEEFNRMFDERMGAHAEMKEEVHGAEWVEVGDHYLIQRGAGDGKGYVRKDSPAAEHHGERGITVWPLPGVPNFNNGELPMLGVMVGFHG